MECPVCGYDYMDVEVNDGRIVYTCPECEKESEDE
jgi:predicted Zn-ribbon and HTH transcriptional regulator